MPNGFVTVAPSSRYGTNNLAFGTYYAWAQKYQCGGSGPQKISEIGIWCYGASYKYFMMGIFTDDPYYNCPESLVANSGTPNLTSGNPPPAKVSHIYSTEPQVTGGDYYWIAVVVNQSAQYFDFKSGSGIDAVLRPQGAYEFPDPNEWHSHIDRPTYDMGAYAVYQPFSITKTVSDVGSGSDTVGFISANVPVADTAQGVDAVIKHLPIETIEFSLKKRSIGFDLNKRGIDYLLKKRSIGFDLNKRDIDFLLKKRSIDFKLH